LASKETPQPFSTQTAHPETTSAAPHQIGEIERQPPSTLTEKTTTDIPPTGAAFPTTQSLREQPPVELESHPEASFLDRSAKPGTDLGATGTATPLDRPLIPPEMPNADACSTASIKSGIVGRESHSKLTSIDNYSGTATTLPSSDIINSGHRAPLTRDESTGYLNTSSTYTARSYPLGVPGHHSESTAPPQESSTTDSSGILPSSSHQNAPHDGREGLATAAGAATIGGAGLAAAESQKDDTGPASKTVGPHKSNIANILDPRVLPEPEKMKNHGARDTDTGPASHTVGPHESNVANVLDPRVLPRPEKQKEHTTVGPHQSDTLNKLDPRVNSNPTQASLPEKNYESGQDPAIAAASYAYGKHSQPKYPADDPTYASPYSSQAIDPRINSTSHAPVAAQTATTTQPSSAQDVKQPHKRDDSAIAGVGTGVAGAAAYEAYKHHEGKQSTDVGDTSPISRRDQTFDSQRAAPSDQAATGHAVKPENVHQGKPATIPEQPKDEDHHHGRDAAIVGGGIAATGGAAAAYEHHKQEAEKAEAERQRLYEQKQSEEAARLQKEHEKQLAAEQKKHEKEVRAAEKSHEKEVKKAGKEHEKEVKKLQKEQSKEEEGKEKKGLFGFLKRDKDKDQEPSEDEKATEEQRLRTEALAGAGAVGAGAAGAYAYDQHKKHEATEPTEQTHPVSGIVQPPTNEQTPVATTAATTTEPSSSRRSSEGKEKKGGLLGFLHRDKEKDKHEGNKAAEDKSVEHRDHKDDAIAGAGAVAAGAAGYGAYEGLKNDKPTTGADGYGKVDTASGTGGSQLSQLESTMPVQQQGVAGIPQQEEPIPTSGLKTTEKAVPPIPAVAMYEQSAPPEPSHVHETPLGTTPISTIAPGTTHEEPVPEDKKDNHHHEEAAVAAGAAGVGAAGYEAHKHHDKNLDTSNTQISQPATGATAEAPTDPSTDGHKSHHRTGLGSMFHSNREYETGQRREPAIEQHAKEDPSFGAVAPVHEHHHGSHHKEEAAAGAGAVGVAAHEHEKHEEHSPDSRKSSDSGEGKEKKKKRTSILGKIFHRHKDDEGKESSIEDTATAPRGESGTHHHDGRNKLHKDPPAGYKEHHGVVTEPHTGLPINTSLGDGAGGTDGNQAIEGYSAHQQQHGEGQHHTADWDTIKKADTPY
jgi:hypothetical protein